MFRISTRLAILLQGIVIKIPLEHKGMLQGINEKMIWKKYKDVAPLAELKWEFLGIIIQKRYTHVDYIPMEEVDRIKAIIPEFQFENGDLWNYENWGVDEEGNYILLDYGNSEYVASLYKK